MCTNFNVNTALDDPATVAFTGRADMQEIPWAGDFTNDTVA